MRKILAAIGRMLAAMAKWTWIGGRLVLQPFAGCIGMSLFSEEEAVAGLDHVATAGRALSKGVGRVASGIAHSGLSDSVVRAGRGLGQAATGLAALPFRAVGAVGRVLMGSGGGGGGGGPSEQAVADQAAQVEEIRQARVAQQRDQSEVLTAMRRCCACKAAGKDSADVDSARLPQELSALMSRMTEREAAIVARTPTRDLQLYLAGKATIEGLRPASDVAAGNAPAPARTKSPEHAAAELRARTRAELREQIRSERRAMVANDIGMAA